MKKLLLSFIILHSSFIFSAAQQIKLDSLYNNWQNESLSDSVRVYSYAEFLYYGCAYSQQDSLILKADTLIKYSEMHNITWGKGNAYNLIGIAYQGQGKFTLAMEYYNKALRIRKEINDKRGIAGTLNNIGNIYSNLGSFPRALEYFKAALKINKELNNVRFIEINLHGIGTIYQLQGNFESALAYFNESLNLTETTGDEDIAAATLNNMAEIYENTKDYEKALAYYQRSLQVFKKHQIENGIVQSTMGLGAVYAGLNNYTKAYESIESALLLSKKLNDQLATATCYVRLGELNQKQDKHSSSLENCNQGLIISEELSALPIQKQACECLYNSYKTLGEGSKALIFLEKIQVIDDSLNAEETSKKLQQMEFAKQVYQDSIATAEKDRLVLEAHQEEMHQEQQTRNVAFGVGAFLLLLAGGLYTRVRYIRKSKATLQVEKDRSENLLLNILPEEIAQELKEKGKADARDFEMVSILFTDFKGFTEASAKMSAGDLVAEINFCFEAFDGIMEKYSIEKIKTIGDAYMAAGGLPVPTDDSVKNTVMAALEMQNFIYKRKSENEMANKPAFEMRVGIHTGPVVAGIVGVKKFQYDIWGDTVNTASRMESNGEVGRVNISQATYELLKDDLDFAFESRGKIEAKGKGEMEMWFVKKVNSN